MRKPIKGFTCTWAVLFAGYIIAGLSDPDGFRTIPGKPDAMSLAIGALVIALAFSIGVLFVIVWPQTLFVSWIVRRFHAPRFFPFALLYVISCVIVGIFICLDCLCGHWVLKWLILATCLFVPCFTLWLISFRHEPVA
jgi:hypothetical protein